LRPFPENIAVLQRLKAHGVTSAILSNGSPPMLQSAVASAGMTHLLNAVISVDPVRTFKTTPASYSRVGEVLALEAREVLFVSSNAWDALGATWFGFQTLWVNRQGLPFETIGPRPHFVGTNLTAVLDALTPVG
jgi:2-haloacid dehalogenase